MLIPRLLLGKRVAAVRHLRHRKPRRLWIAAGVGALEDEAYTRRNCTCIADNREALKETLRKLGFSSTDSKSNFIFVKHPALPGAMLYEKLKARGILVRHFKTPRIADYSRITIGTAAQMEALVAAVQEILKEAV